MTAVAVIVPCYDLGRTIPETLSSIDRQTRQSAEVIVVDDGSGDPHTRWVLDRLAREGRTVVRTGNRGVAAARKLGVDLTHSPYVVLLDADDALEPEFVERLAAVLDERDDVDFVTCGMQAFGEASYTWLPTPCTWMDVLARSGPHVSSMFRRTLWDAVGGFDDRLSGYEDLDFWLSAIEQGCRGEIVPAPLLRYRVRRASRYRRAIHRASYVATMTQIHRKHPPPSVEVGRALLLDKERFIDEQRAHHRYLVGQRDEHRRALTELSERARHETALLTARGEDAVDWGDLRRISPISPVWGLNRGRPVDRYYIENFLDRHQPDIRGAVLEVKDPYYSTRFGGQRVTEAAVVDVDASNSRATIIADLTDAGAAIRSEAFDCFILTQTLHIIFDIGAVLATAYRVLRPGGVLLCTVPCISRISFEDGGLDDGDFWRFTEASIRAAVTDVFSAGDVEVSAHGNVTVCAAFLLGLDPGEVPDGHLDETDPACPLICCIRAVKRPSAPSASAAAPLVITGSDGLTRARRHGAILLYHRIGQRRPDTYDLCVAHDDFRRHMRHLRNACQPLALDELVDAAGRGALPDGAVAVTFDDGYLEHLTLVSPILREYGIPATFYCNTNRLEVPHEAWWDLLERILLTAGLLPPSLDLYNDGTWVRSTVTDEDRRHAHRALMELAYPLAADARTAIVGRVCDWSGLDLSPRQSHRVLTGDELGQLAAQPGHRIGAHTVRHLCLPRQPRDVQVTEMADCKSLLERTLRQPVRDLAYPYGEHDRDTLEAARIAGFARAVTVVPGVVGVASQRLLLPRLEIGPGNAADVETLLSRTFSGARP